MRELRGKVALVTGAASGIGRATAVSLAQAGARVIVCDVSPSGVETMRVLLGERCLLGAVVDVSDRGQMRAFAEQVHALVPAVDVLVNNAGIAVSGGMLSTPLEDWDRLFGVNVFGVVHGCHFFVPKMVERGEGGHVVNVSSAAGYFASPMMLGYAATKFAVLGLSEGLRVELSKHRIGVSTICPGIVNTGIIDATEFRGQRDAGAARAQAKKLYAARNYPPERVADEILDAIRRDRGVVPVTPEAWAMYLSKRYFPRTLGAILRASDRFTP